MNGYDERDHAEEAFNLATMREDFSGYKECGHPEYRNTGDGPQPNDCGCTDSDEQDIRDIMAGNWSAASDEMANLAAGLLPGELEAMEKARQGICTVCGENWSARDDHTCACTRWTRGYLSARPDLHVKAIDLADKIAQRYPDDAECIALARALAESLAPLAFAAHAQAGVEAIAEASK